MPDRRTWHRAQAVFGADDAVAADLDAASDWARARGGYSAQALFLSRAAELTTEPTERAERYLAAAEAYLTAGDHAAVRPLLDLAAPALSRPATRARALRIRASAELFNTRSDRVAAMMLDAVAELGDADVRMTWELLYEAVHAAVIARDPMYRTTMAEVADAVAAAPRDPDAPPWSPNRLIEALVSRAAYGYRSSVAGIQAALADLRASPELRDMATPFSVLVSLAATDVWDIDANIEISSSLAAVDRSQGALYGLGFCVSDFAYTQIWNGPHTSPSTPGARHCSLNGLGSSCSRPARPRASAPWAPDPASHRRNERWPCWRCQGSPTPRSPRGCSSRPRPSSST
jgi:hypothetical protein